MISIFGVWSSTRDKSHKFPSRSRKDILDDFANEGFLGMSCKIEVVLQSLIRVRLSCKNLARFLKDLARQTSGKRY